MPNRSGCKPFVKWVGGKSNLLPTIREYYPCGKKKYIDPFVGGGAVLFDVLNTYQNLESVVIGDANENLINTYVCIRDNVDEVLSLCNKYKKEFDMLPNDKQKEYYLQKRALFNSIQLKTCGLQLQNPNIVKASLMIFLNKTCFNGVYRVNKKGIFNVGFGKYITFRFDEKNIIVVSNKLKPVQIYCCDYHFLEQYIDEETFVYFDPPYKPISKTSNFVSYTIHRFNDLDQQELAKFIKEITTKGAKVLVSNSYQDDDFFTSMYDFLNIEVVTSNRGLSVNPMPKRKVNELLMYN